MGLPVLVLALGSPHGDDQAGWLVAELLGRRGVEGVSVIQNMDELLWLLSPGSKVILVDACQSGAKPGAIYRLRWPDSRILLQVGVSSHGLDLAYTLRLAESLGKIPDDLTVYAIEIRSGDPRQSVDIQVSAAACKVAEMINQELIAEGLADKCTNVP